MSKSKMYRGSLVQPGTKMMEFLEKGDTKMANKLDRAMNKMRDANYDYKVVQQVRRENPDLY